MKESIVVLEKRAFINKSYFQIRKKNINSRIIFITSLFISFFWLILIFIHINKFKKNNNHDIGQIKKYKPDNITLVTAYYPMQSKYPQQNYIKWINLTLQVNCSMIIFSNKEFIEKIKEIRPTYLHNKTIFIELEMKDFYSYKKYINEFNKTYNIDPEKSYHSVPLYLVWAEKCSFLKKAILNNYFDSTCFYWIDAGYFRAEEEIGNFVNNWPSPKKCYEDKRVILAQIRKIPENEKNLLLNFDENTHILFQFKTNVGAGIFGGYFENVLKFINFYYEAIEIFVSKKLFIGKEQNIFTYVALSHPDIINFIPGYYYILKSYLS